MLLCSERTFQASCQSEDIRLSASAQSSGQSTERRVTWDNMRGWNQVQFSTSHLSLRHQTSTQKQSEKFFWRSGEFCQAKGPLIIKWWAVLGLLEDNYCNRTLWNRHSGVALGSFKDVTDQTRLLWWWSCAEIIYQMIYYLSPLSSFSPAGQHEKRVQQLTSNNLVRGRPEYTGDLRH